MARNFHLEANFLVERALRRSCVRHQHDGHVAASLADGMDDDEASEGHLPWRFRGASFNSASPIRLGSSILPECLEESQTWFCHDGCLGRDGNLSRLCLLHLCDVRCYVQPGRFLPATGIL